MSTKRSVSKRGDLDPDPSGFYSAGLAAGGSTSAAEVLIQSLQPKPKDEVEIESFEPEATEKPKRVGFFALFKYSTRGEKAWIILGAIMASISGLSMPIWLMVLAESLETFNQIGSIIAAGGSIDILLDQMWALIYSFAIVGAISLVSGSSYVAIWTYVGEVQTLRIRKAFVKSALRQESAWFDKRGGDRAEFPVIAANSLLRIQIALCRAPADTLSNLLSAAGCVAVSMGLDAPLALFMLCTLPLIAIAIGIVSCYMRKYSGLAMAEFATAGAFATEVLSGIKTVASLRAEKWAVNQYTEHVTEAQQYNVRSQFLTKLATGIMGLLFYITYTFSFIFGTYQASQRTEIESTLRTPFSCYFEKNDCGIHGSEVMVCIYGVILCAQFFALMSPGINAINLGRTAAAEIYSAIERVPEIDGTDEFKGEKLGSDYDGSVELKDVVFAYPSRPKDIIFNNFNLKIEAGSAVALVGPSGSGKSSLSRLLLRLYDPIGGDILVGGHRLTDINLKWWRSQIGYVPQEPTLVPGTIRDNIAAGKLEGNASDDEVRQAAIAASAHEFIMDLPDGYDTFYSGSSIMLSGGQIQRLCIARALIRNPKIMLLDEATSALDTQSERTVQEALEKIRDSRKLTTVTVAHRLSTIVKSDKIVVIADGSIQEVGTHRELVEEGGIYATLCEGQGLTADAADETKQKSENMPEEAVPEPTKTIPLGKDDDIVAETEDIEGDSDVSTKGVYSRLREHNKSEFVYTLVGYFGALVVGALPAGEAVLFGLITGNFFLISDAEEMRSTNYSLSMWFLLLSALSFIGNAFVGVGLGVSGSRLTKRMRVLVFDSLMGYSMGWFDFPEHSTGELTTKLEEDSEKVGNVTGLSQGQVIQTYSCLVAGMVVALAYSWQIGLTAIACVPLILGASALQAKFAKKEPKHAKDDHYVSPATLLERAFSDLVVLQAFGLQDETSTKYAASLDPDVQFKKKQAGFNGLAFGVSQFAVFGTFALIFWAGIELMISKKLGFTEFFVALLSVMFSSFGAGQTGADFSSRKAGLEAAARLFEISDGSVDDEDDPFAKGGERPSKLEGKVVFQNCHFAYPTRKNAPVYYKNGDRDGFSLDIDSRQSVAFTGRSGCGKSTALQILLRFYRVNSGSVELDDQNLYSLNLGWLRDQIGYVGQMPVLFQGSVRDNIRLGKPNATEQEIIEAAKSANAHDFICGLSNGYDTDIGVGGLLLSGGQRQRVAIARAIVKNPKLLVLDEATAALDNESEKIVQAALDKMQEVNPRTTLVVAHRLETVKNCDKIVVLEHGGVKEEGTHSQLLDQKGLYFSLWSKQNSG